MLRNWANGLPLIGKSPYSSGLQSVINITLFDSDTPLMRASKQFKRFAATLAGVSAAAAFLSGQALVGTALCTIAALFGVSTLHRIGRARDEMRGHAPLLAPIPNLEQRKRMLQEVA